MPLATECPRACGLRCCLLTALVFRYFPPACAHQVGEAEKELGGAAATNPFAQLVDEAEGLDKIEDLQVGGWVWGAGGAGGQEGRCVLERGRSKGLCGLGSWLRAWIRGLVAVRAPARLAARLPSLCYFLARALALPKRG